MVKLRRIERRSRVRRDCAETKSAAVGRTHYVKRRRHKKSAASRVAGNTALLDGGFAQANRGPCQKLHKLSYQERMSGKALKLAHHAS